MTLKDYLKECKESGHEPFYVNRFPPDNDNCFGIHNNHVIENLEDRINITKELNDILEKLWHK